MSELYPVFALTENGWRWFEELNHDENPAVDIHLGCDHVMRTRFRVLESGEKFSEVTVLEEKKCF